MKATKKNLLGRKKSHPSTPYGTALKNFFLLSCGLLVFVLVFVESFESKEGLVSGTSSSFVSGETSIGEGHPTAALPSESDVRPSPSNPESTVSLGSSAPSEPLPGRGEGTTPPKNAKDGFSGESTSESSESLPSPSPLKAPDFWSQAEELTAEMSLSDKLYQLMVVYPESIGLEALGSSPEETEAILHQDPVGGILYRADNFSSQEQVAQMLRTVQEGAKYPLLLTCDEEGGTVNRLMHQVGTTYIGPMLDYADQGPEVARQNAATIAEDMSALGFNLDFAPVADVWSNPQNTVIGNRAYSHDFQQAAELIPAAVQGFHQGGVACSLKHFPGHGDTLEDSHLRSATIRKTLDALRQEELLPFQAGIDAGADLVMVGHLMLGEGTIPAVFSYDLVTGVLREEMGFQGLVITDGLEMKAMTDHYSSEEVARNAIQAGVDLLLCPPDLEASLNALKDAVTEGLISEERIDLSVTRVLHLKLTYGLFPAE